MPTLMELCQDLSWVAPNAARRLSRAADRAFRAVVWIGDVDIEGRLASVRHVLLDVEEALVAHDPERARMEAEVREQGRRLRAQWDAEDAAKGRNHYRQNPSLPDEEAGVTAADVAAAINCREPGRGIDPPGVSFDRYVDDGGA